MITSLFRKSTPLNYSLILVSVFFFFFIYQIQLGSELKLGLSFIEKAALLLVILVSLFVINFIVKKNGLSKDSSYTVLFYFLFLLIFPSVWNNIYLMLSNFFLLLALRRLISMGTNKAIKEKIFDASLWIFLASLFHFWAILFIILVFVAIVFHASRDYRNWALPFIAFFTIGTLFVLSTLILNTDRISILLESAQINYKIDYFVNNYENLALSLYATVSLFFIVSIALTFSNRPLMLHATYKKTVLAFFIGVAVFIISPNKSSDLLVFTFAPLTILATSHIEIVSVKWQKEVVLVGVILISFFCFFAQL